MRTSSILTAFKMKLIAAYVTENIDSSTGENVGLTSMIYLNPGCNEDIMHCDISAGTAEDGQSYSNIVTTFFNFLTPTAANIALNAESRGIELGTYRYARLEFCKTNSASADNVLWNDTTGNVSYRHDQCAVNSAAFSSPVTVKDGDSLTFTLSYDLSGVLTADPDTSADSCNGTTCFTLPTFVPSVE